MSSPLNLREELNNYLTRNEVPVTSTKLMTTNKINLFSKFKYAPLPTENSNSNDWFDLSSNDCCPALSRIQRLIGFCFCICIGLTFFGTAMLFLPVLMLKARKFCLLFTFGSLFLILSFSFLWGPMNHLKHLFSKERLPFTCSYFGTLGLTLYFAMFKHILSWTIFFAALQITTLMWFLLSYIPGGFTGISFFTRLFSSSFTNTVSKTLPV